MSRPPKKHIFKIVDKAVTTLDCALQYAELGLVGATSVGR